MPIGYANFSTIEQANNQTVNQLAGLGKQIGNAIETHAATQSAQAMLPVIQQQYASGMGKIALGDQSGMADVIQAAGLAGQNPLTAGYGKNMIAGMQQVSEMSRAKAIADARLDAIGERGDYAASLSAQNFRQRDYLESKKQQGAFTPYQRTQANVNQAKLYNSIFQGKPDTAKGPGEPGIGPLAEKINTAINNGEAPDPADVRNLATKYAEYRQVQSAYGQNAIAHPEIESAFNQLQDQIPKLGNLVSEEAKKGEGGWFGWGRADKSKIQSLNQEVEQLQKLKSLGGIPAAQGNADQMQGQQSNPKSNKFSEGQMLRQNGKTYRYSNGTFTEVQ